MVLAHVTETGYGQSREEVLSTYGQSTLDELVGHGEEMLEDTAESETFSGLEVETQVLFGDPGAFPARPRGPGEHRRNRHGQPRTRDLGDHDHGLGQPARRARGKGAGNHRSAASGAAEEIAS